MGEQENSGGKECAADQKQEKVLNRFTNHDPLASVAPPGGETAVELMVFLYSSTMNRQHGTGNAALLDSSAAGRSFGPDPAGGLESAEGLLPQLRRRCCTMPAAPPP